MKTPVAQEMRKGRGRMSVYKKHWLLIQPMMRTLMKKVRTLRMELILNSRESLGVDVTM